MAGEIRLMGTGQLIELRRRLRAAGGPRLQQNFARRIRRAAEPLKDDLESTMRGLELRSQGRTTRKGGPSPTTRPLRAAIADALRITVRGGANPGARVWVDKGQLPADMRDMPTALDDPSKRVRHPVFNNRRKWTNQYVSVLWWTDTVKRHQPRMRAEVERITDDVRRSLGG